MIEIKENVKVNVTDAANKTKHGVIVSVDEVDIKDPLENITISGYCTIEWDDGTRTDDEYIMQMHVR